MIKLAPYLQNAKHVIWDWNGTLLSDVEYTVNTVNSLLKERNLSTLNIDSYRKVFGFPIRKYYDELGFDYTHESFEDLCHVFVNRYMGGVFGCSMFPGAQDLLAQVKTMGKTQSVLSASDQESLDTMMDHFNIRQHLDYTYGIPDKMAASKVARGKELILASGIDPEDTLLFGDTDHDLEVGQELGVPVVLVAHGHQCALKLKKIHHTVVEWTF